MARGRPKDPGAVKRGTSHRPACVSPPVGLAITNTPEQLALASPETLPEGALEMWRVAAEELCSLRTFHVSDLPLLEMLVIAVYRHRQAQAHIEQLGVLVKGSRGPMVNPLLKTERDEAVTYLRLAETLGLTPVARLRLGLISLSGQSILASIDAQLGVQGGCEDRR